MSIDANNLSDMIEQLGATAVWSVIESQFLEKEQKTVSFAKKEQKDKDFQRLKYLNTGTKWIICAALLFVMFYIAIFSVTTYNKQHIEAETACKSGDTQRCLKGVSDEGGTFTEDDTDSAKLVQLYRTEYKIATGHDLPLLVGETEPAKSDFNHGWTISTNDNEATVSKNHTTVKVEDR